jgi:hypothetical protein
MTSWHTLFNRALRSDTTACHCYIHGISRTAITNVQKILEEDVEFIRVQSNMSFVADNG